LENVSPLNEGRPEHTLVGRIHFGDSQFCIPCVVKQITKNSASLHVFDSGRLPSVFWLNIDELGINEECRLVEKTKRIAQVVFDRTEFHPYGESEIGVTSPKSVTATNPPSPRASQLQSVPKLWVVEDDEDDRLLLAEAFEDSKFQCELEYFKDGVEFLEHIDKFDFQDRIELNQIIALIDINMPRMDGIKALAKLRQKPACQNLPVMMFSTSESDDDLRKTYDLGISAYLPKPNSQDDMYTVVDFIVNFWKVKVRISPLPSDKPDHGSLSPK